VTVFGPYRGVVDRVQDGDTIYIKLDLGFDLTVYARVRVYGINAPELSTDAGKVAKAYAITICPTGASVSVLSHGWDAYGGRIDGAITLPDGTDFATRMVDSGNAVWKVYR
jgi:endonuclease YncB( thermonuclease family)